MKSKLATAIMTIIILLIVGVFILFGIIIWQEAGDLNFQEEVEDFQTVFSSDQNTVDTESIQTPEVVDNPLEDLKDTAGETSVDYSQVSVDSYFYQQLEEPSKTIYKAFKSNEENMKSGTYRIDFGNQFSDILDQQNGQELLGDYYQSAIEAYTYDNPQIFYLSPNKMYLNIETTTTSLGNSYQVYINNGDQSNYFVDEFSSGQEVENAISQIEQVKNSLLANRTGDTYQDIKMVHDYLVETISYDESLARENIYNIYGALGNKLAVCEGYARAFKYIMDEMQIPCVLVIGQGTNTRGETENHAWNYVQLQGNWYAVDCTWDDPVVIGGGTVSNSSKYRYFLKGSNTFSTDHIPSGQFTPGGKMFNYPSLSVQDFE